MLGNGGLGEFQGSNFLYNIGSYARDLESIKKDMQKHGLIELPLIVERASLD